MYFIKRQVHKETTVSTLNFMTELLKFMVLNVLFYKLINCPLIRVRGITCDLCHTHDPGARCEGEFLPSCLYSKDEMCETNYNQEFNIYPK